jgi:hypothetical protein
MENKKPIELNGDVVIVSLDIIFTLLDGLFN